VDLTRWKVQDASVQDGPLVQGRAQGAVQAVLQIELALPLDHVREQIAVERRILGQQRVKVEHRFRGDQRVEPDLAWRYLGPLSIRETVFGIGASVADQLKDHPMKFRRGWGRPLSPG
jgi:hypothetical protein